MRILLLITFIGFGFLVNAQCVKGNCHNGRGKFVYPNGDQYEGQWKDGKMHGSGKYEYSNGDRYDGDFHFDKKDGSGTYVWKDKGSYTGQWKNDLRDGYGVYKWTSSATYIGFWKQGKIINTDIGETSTSNSKSCK